jgi:subtilase family serine protease
MDNLVTLITVLIIIAIIAAIIIAAAVFLSGRRPTGTWAKQE